MRCRVLIFRDKDAETDHRRGHRIIAKELSVPGETASLLSGQCECGREEHGGVCRRLTPPTRSLSIVSTAPPRQTCGRTQFLKQEQEAGAGCASALVAGRD